jgi:hypothetical protein
MAEVKMGGIYRVTVTEYERGWGQRTDENDTKYFTTIEEAEAYKEHWETGGTADYFWRATIEKI